MKAMMIYKRMLILFLAMTVVGSCAVNPVTGKRQLMLVSEEQEDQMGKQYDPQIIATFGEYKNQRLLSFLQSRANEIGKISHRPNVSYKVRLLDSPVVNAFAVPGGYIYFTRGILAHFNSEAQMVGVLGHEMGHVAARHSTSQQSKQQLGQILLLGGMIASEKFAQYADYAMQGMQLLFLKYSRDDESQSDKLGVEYATKIGYDAGKMADFFKVLDRMSTESGQGRLPAFLSTHPDPGDRYNNVKELAKAWQDSAGTKSWKVNADSYLAMIDGITYGEDPRQGYTEGNTFYHPDLKFKFSFPKGWQIQNQPSQVNMAPPDGKAIIIFSLARGRSLEDAARSNLQQLNITPGESKKTSINGMSALLTVSQHVSKDQAGGQEVHMVMSAFIDYGRNYYVFHGVSAQSDFNTYSPAFNSTITGFSKLNDPSKLNVKPKKVSVQKARRSGSLSEVLREFGMDQKLFDELSLLNQMELNARVDQGRPVKLIVQ